MTQCHKTHDSDPTPNDDKLHEGDIIHYTMYQKSLSDVSQNLTHAYVLSRHVSDIQYQQQQQLEHVNEERRQQQLFVIQNDIRQALIQQKIILQHLSQKEHLISQVSSTHSPTQVDIEVVLKQSRMELEQSGWYYGQLSWQQSSELLHATSEGTFLVRDSRDPRFLYSLSLQRAKGGPTSVRISFSHGKFSLDADNQIKSLMPEFYSVGALVSHYVMEPEQGDIMKTINTRLYIKKPLYKQPPSLAHSARLSFNKSFKKSPKFSTQHSESVQIPRKLMDYLHKYSFCI